MVEAKEIFCSCYQIYVSKYFFDSVQRVCSTASITEYLLFSYKFVLNTINFFGYVIYLSGLEIAAHTADVVQEWKQQRNIT